MIELLLVILLAAIILGAIYWVLAVLFHVPYPWPLVIVGVIVIVLLLALVGDSGGIDVGDGR